MATERRSFQRVPVHLPATMRLADADLVVAEDSETWSGHILDACVGGVLIVANKRFEPGTNLVVSADVAGTTMEFVVAVRHQFTRGEGGAEQYGHGAQIVGANRWHLVWLMNGLSQLRDAALGRPAYQPPRRRAI